MLSGSDPDCYPGQWVIRVSSSDPVSTLSQEAQDEDSNVTIIPEGDPDSGMPASEAEIPSNNTRGPEQQVSQDTSISESLVLDHITEEAEISDESSNFGR